MEPEDPFSWDTSRLRQDGCNRRQVLFEQGEPDLGDSGVVELFAWVHALYNHLEGQNRGRFLQAQKLPLRGVFEDPVPLDNLLDLSDPSQRDGSIRQRYLVVRSIIPAHWRDRQFASRTVEAKDLWAGKA